MTLTWGIFTLQCVITILSAVLTIIMGKNPINSVVYLVSCFLNCALIFVILGVNLLGYLYIIVYVGAIAILFIFVIMMMDLRNISDNPTSPQGGRGAVGAKLSYPLAIMTIITLGLINGNNFPADLQVGGQGDGLISGKDTISRLNPALLVTWTADGIINDFTTWEIAQRNLWDTLCPNSMNTVLHTVGYILYTDYISLLLLISLILLMVMISVIALIREARVTSLL